MADDPLDQLYAVAPEEFTALRTRLAAAAKKRGDAAAAKEIAGARKPTVSASVVNRLVHADPGARDRLAELGEQLRAAHAAMDGGRLRDLSARQRKLVDELTRAALRAAGVGAPSAALRDDVTDTLQAAIADPEVTARLGRLTKAEQWSGFGGFGETAMVLSSPAPPKKPTKPSKASNAPEDRRQAPEERRQRDQAKAVLAAAERAKADADEAMGHRQSDLATARLRVDDARNRLARAEQALSEAEQALREAEAAYGDAKDASREAGEVVKAAKAGLR
ncbi:hypothetical protein E4P42_23985 [Mycobacterium sp. PS03-16]|uniref:hypothetical protein n=1 Tax=Mycobacterium sp. PS03-16 TaxID=2559611 RepID=UPI001073057B|nr:hypothetical protein [Mycobacterium sp. PS03-16]TFV55054.1 hypothetical protein E4P42_23985 [Mycobacterium sp. PS03-16]